MPWVITNDDAEILAVHATMLPTGKILYFTGSEYSRIQQEAYDFAHARLYDCSADALELVAAASANDDLFCCGHILMADGRVLVAGGTERFDEQTHQETASKHLEAKHSVGIRNAWRFDPFSTSWEDLPPMLAGPSEQSKSTRFKFLTGGGLLRFLAGESPPKLSHTKPRFNFLPGGGLLRLLAGESPPKLSHTKPRLNFLTGGRWYPTLLGLDTGEALAFGGHPGSGDARHHNNVVEIFDGNDWHLGEGGAFDKENGADAFYYPRLHLLDDGNVLCLSPLEVSPSEPSPVQMYGRKPSYQPRPKEWYSISEDGSHTPLEEIYTGRSPYRTSSVMLPINLVEGPRMDFLLVGGVDAWLVMLRRLEPQDITQAPYEWRYVIQETQPRQMGRERRNCNTVLLPTGEVFVCGGVNGVLGIPAQAIAPSHPERAHEFRPFALPQGAEISDDEAVLEAELYSPETGIWKTLEAAHRPRQYHSVALLMPDGRVWTAGSNIDGHHIWADLPPDDQRTRCELFRCEIEVYSPWYCDRGDRPTIHQVTGDRLVDNIVTFGYSGSFLVETDNARSIGRVAMLRVGSVTHSFNVDQRYLILAFEAESDRRIVVQSPPSEFLAPPGVYLIFILNQDGVPSIGQFAYLRPPPDLDKLRHLRPRLDLDKLRHLQPRPDLDK